MVRLILPPFFVSQPGIDVGRPIPVSVPTSTMAQHIPLAVDANGDMKIDLLGMYDTTGCQCWKSFGGVDEQVERDFNVYVLFFGTV